MKEIIVKENNIRIDIYLAKELDLSRSKIQKLIKDEKVTVNNEIISSNYLVKESDCIKINDELDYTINITGEDIDLDIIYEDENLLIINKPSGMVTHPAPGNYSGTLVNALLGKYDLKGDNLRPGIVHRLDKDTSGLMVVAKNEKYLEILSNMIKERTVKRTYIALVEGTFNHETGTIDAPIGRDPNNREKMMVTDVNAKESVTHFKVIKRFNKYTLVECNLDTGRTHQIRVHMSYIGHPVVNDPVYGKVVKGYEDFGQLLHSTKIEFINPSNGELLSYKVEAPELFYKIMEEVTNESY